MDACYTRQPPRDQALDRLGQIEIIVQFRAKRLVTEHKSGIFVHSNEYKLTLRRFFKPAPSKNVIEILLSGARRCADGYVHVEIFCSGYVNRA